ncbi:MAG: shikimate kinase [Geitlerinemataceae cyanobacterium]
MRALIVGNSGAGKTTFARKLFPNCPDADRPILNLDAVAWGEPIDGKPMRRSSADSINAIEAFTRDRDNWAIEGCYGDLLAAIASQATVLYWLDPGTDICLDRCRNRTWEPEKFATPAEQDAALAYLLEWVATYDDREDEFGRDRHAALFGGFPGEKYRLIND